MARTVETAASEANAELENVASEVNSVYAAQASG
jgi:hypothetical protein